MRALLIPTLLAAAAGAAQAQTAATASDLQEVHDETMTVEALGLTVDELEDMEVHGPGGYVVGEVDDTLMGADGPPTAVTLEIENLPGGADRDVVLPIDQLRMEGGQLVTDLTAAEAEGLPTWDD